MELEQNVNKYLLSCNKYLLTFCSFNGILWKELKRTQLIDSQSQFTELKEKGIPQLLERKDDAKMMQ